MRRRFNLVVFDWDGTLMDSIDRIIGSMEAAVAELSLEPIHRMQIRDIIGLGLPEAIATLFPAANTATRASIAERYRHHFVEASPIPAPLFPGARETLQCLYDDGYLLAVATGKARRGLRRVLEDTDCAHLFHATRCADEAPSKPHPQMLTEILAELDVRPDAALMIGDTEYDMKMALDAGVAALAVSYGVHSPERLGRQRPLSCLHDISELLPWLAQYDGVDNCQGSPTI